MIVTVKDGREISREESVVVVQGDSDSTNPTSTEIPESANLVLEVSK